MVYAKTGAFGHVGVAITFGLVIMVMIYSAGTSPARASTVRIHESMRSIGPAIASGNFHALWLYIVALRGASIGALAYQFVRGEPTEPPELKRN
jgi:hypothetical protein